MGARVRRGQRELYMLGGVLLTRGARVPRHASPSGPLTASPVPAVDHGLVVAWGGVSPRVACHNPMVNSWAAVRVWSQSATRPARSRAQRLPAGILSR